MGTSGRKLNSNGCPAATSTNRHIPSDNGKDGGYPRLSLELPTRFVMVRAFVSLEQTINKELRIDHETESNGLRSRLRRSHHGATDRGAGIGGCGDDRRAADGEHAQGQGPRHDGERVPGRV